MRSIIGRLLEHTRIYYFYAGGEESIYCASADWMYRNLHRRVEVACPIEDLSLKARIIEEVLDWGLQDNVQAWVLGSNTHYTRAEPEDGEVAFISQEALIARLADHGHRGASQYEDSEQSMLARRKSKSKGKRNGRHPEKG